MFKRRLLCLMTAAVIASAMPVMTYAEETVNDAGYEEATDIAADDSAEMPSMQNGAELTGNEQTEGDYKYTVESDGAHIKKYTGSAAELTIPAALGGKTVVAIDHRAFNACNTLTKVTVADSIKSLESYAFSGCEKLTEIKLSNGIKVIPEYCFADCKLLSKVEMSDAVETISAMAFSSCESLSDFDLPAGVVSVGQQAFQSCKALKKITVRKGIKELKHLTFSDCESLAEIVFEEGTQLETIGDYCFIGCSSLNEVEIPDTVTLVDEYAFTECEAIKGAKLSNKMTKISVGTFKKCDNLTKAYIPKSVKTMGQTIFECLGGSKLSDIYYEGSESDWKNIEIEQNNDAIGKAKIHYNSSVDDYRKDSKNPSNPDKPVTPSGNSASQNAPKTETVSRNGAEFTYNTEIAFPGKKIKADNFGTITISYNGQTYTAEKIKINKKNHKIQIKKITPADKKVQKELKKLTKGDGGLDFKVRSYLVSDTDDIKTKINKKGELKSVSIRLGDKYYKCKKDEYSYDAAAKKITFKGNNLSGEYIIK